MKLKVYPSSHFVAKFKKICRKDKRISKIVDARIKVLAENPQHQSLRLHKLSGKVNQWSIWIKKDLRIIFQYVKSGILLVDIGSHKEVY